MSEWADEYLTLLDDCEKRASRIIADDKPSIRIGPYWHAPLCWGEEADAAIDAAKDAS